MGDAIEFPKNHDIYLIKAMSNLQQGNLKKAEEFVEKAYQLKKENASNILYTSILVEQGNYVQAKEIAEEFFHLYESTEGYQLFFLSILVNLQQFHQAESLIQRWEKQKNGITESWEEMKETLQKEKKKMFVQQEKENEIFLKNFRNLGNVSVEEQMNLLQSVEKIPVDAFQKMTRSHLLNPFVSNETKTILLHYLIDQKTDNRYQILWFDEMREIIPIEKKPMDRLPIYQEIHQHLKNELESNPTMEKMLEQEIDRHLLQLYPFIEEIVVDPAEWVSYYLKQYSLDGLTQTDQQTNQNMSRWFHYLLEKDGLF